MLRNINNGARAEGSTLQSLVFGRIDPRKAVRIGAALVIVGIATIVIGVSAGWFAFLFLGGMGIGASFSGTLRTLAPLANPSARAELFAAIYLVSYLAYGAPALVASELIGLVGLTHHHHRLRRRGDACGGP